MSTALGIGLGIVLILALTAATGYFVAMEFAYVAVDRNALKQLADDGDAAAERAMRVTSQLSFTLSAALLGIGWSLVTMGTTLWVHEDGEPSRWLLGLHDGALLGSALLGALAAGVVH